MIQARQQIDFHDQQILDDNESLSDLEVDENMNPAEHKAVAEFQVHSNN
jgi:hypothetical protein